MATPPLAALSAMADAGRRSGRSGAARFAPTANSPTTRAARASRRACRAAALHRLRGPRPELGQSPFCRGGGHGYRSNRRVPGGSAATDRAPLRGENIQRQHPPPAEPAGANDIARYDSSHRSRRAHPLILRTTGWNWRGMERSGESAHTTPLAKTKRAGRHGQPFRFLECACVCGQRTSR